MPFVDIHRRQDYAWSLSSSRGLGGIAKGFSSFSVASRSTLGAKMATASMSATSLASSFCGSCKDIGAVESVSNVKVLGARSRVFVRPASKKVTKVVKIVNTCPEFLPRINAQNTCNLAKNQFGDVIESRIEKKSDINPTPFQPYREVFGPQRCTRIFFEVLETLASRVLRVGDAARDAILKPNTQEEVQLLAALKGRMVCAAAPLLVAAISQSVNTPLTVVASGMAKWLELYSGVLMVRVLLSWFPNIPWERQPLQAMRDMCDPYLNLFRNIIPPLFNALDLSPMLAFLVLGVLTSILNTTVQAT